MEKPALLVVTAALRLRRYFQSNTIIVMTSQPLRTLLLSPRQPGILAKWEIKLSEYIGYKSQTSSKAHMLTDFVIELVPQDVHPVTKTENKGSTSMERPQNKDLELGSSSNIHPGKLSSNHFAYALVHQKTMQNTNPSP